MPEQPPVPPFSRRLPSEVADRTKATAAVSVPSGEAQAMRKDCYPVVVHHAFGNPHTVENDTC